MDRRSFIETCTATAACLQAGALPAFAANALPREHAKALLVTDTGQPLRASTLKPGVNYVFCYPFEATPVFLLELGKPAAAQMIGAGGAPHVWPGGVGRQRSIVAYAAICTHKLVYPTPQVSFISFRKTKAQRGVQDGLIHCCADHSQYDPARGASVMAGPAPQPLLAVLLAHDPQADTLTAYGTLGTDVYDAFFDKYAAKLSLDMGPKAREPVRERAVVSELERYCRNNVQC